MAHGQKLFRLQVKHSAYLDSPERESIMTLDRLPEWAKIGETSFPDSILEIKVYESGKLIFEYRKEEII